jgi:hypothetical protein
VSSHTKSKLKVKRTDPVLPDLGGRSMPGDPSLPEANAVRVRAYQLYGQRGRVEGHALEDWVTAKAQITGGQPLPPNAR